MAAATKSRGCNEEPRPGPYGEADGDVDQTSIPDYSDPEPSDEDNDDGDR